MPGFPMVAGKSPTRLQRVNVRCDAMALADTRIDAGCLQAFAQAASRLRGKAAELQFDHRTHSSCNHSLRVSRAKPSGR